MQRFVKKGLSEYEAEILVDDPELANYYEKAIAAYKSKSIVNWILRNLLGYLKDKKIKLIECKVTPEKLAEIVQLLQEGVINNHAAQQVFEIVAQTGQEPKEVVEQKGLKQVGSVEELEKIVLEIITENPKQVEQFKAGNERLFAFFVGQSMKKTQGKGNPKVIQELLKKHLQ